jgi:hypothetical protein
MFGIARARIVVLSEQIDVALLVSGDGLGITDIEGRMQIAGRIVSQNQILNVPWAIDQFGGNQGCSRRAGCEIVDAGLFQIRKVFEQVDVGTPLRSVLVLGTKRRARFQKEEASSKKENTVSRVKTV